MKDLNQVEKLATRKLINWTTWCRIRNNKMLPMNWEENFDEESFLAMLRVVSFQVKVHPL